MKKWWITMTNNSHFKTLKIKSVNESDKSKEKDFSNCIWFNNKGEAEEFLEQMKELIEENYSGAKDWFK
ncbi:hypothetical protein [Prevotella intermedia]|uniref:Uncharacterized protein n=1 Tax=Prevotella intermedia TaxID=28131 RepID=A0A2G8ID07_PREIN|nr:hypothetical protein [Prevotella intermedia]PIK21404.1 hypothetical protein CTI18_08865 [Prevotella intermedia]